MTNRAFELQAEVLARDLSLRLSGDPLAAIFQYCEKRVAGFLAKYGQIKSLDELLALVANHLGSTFEFVQSGGELAALKASYLADGERAFVNIDTELDDETFGITLRLDHPRFGMRYVSVIDCRGPKSQARYFTQWHELAHLLVLTDQQRISWRRTHAGKKDAEERIVDAIAGRFAFHRALVEPFVREGVSFEIVRSVKAKLCPNSSWQAATLGVVNACPRPCFLLRAKRAPKKRATSADDTTLALRAIQVSRNDAARRAGLQIYPNMRVPARSVITRVHDESINGAQATEDLSWWETSTGEVLESCRVQTHARQTYDGVEAILTAL
ncbi:MAG TPA: hypothetical protein VGQ65_11630 [Thermoanaerobaculia bacterium]|jgi:hypothetical protein|nr:hypothetical protein [Thermoanaerobaculia bacterium]